MAFRKQPEPPLNQLTNLSADWQRNLASVKFSKLDTSIIQSAEAIICNNDDMALGVYDYYKQHNLKLPLFSELITVQR